MDPGLPDKDTDREGSSERGDAIELSIPQVFLAVALGPVVLSTCIRVAIMDPLLFFAQADWANFELTGAERACPSAPVSLRHLFLLNRLCRR